MGHLTVLSLVGSHLTLGSSPGSGLQICFNGPYNSLKKLKNSSPAFKNQEIPYTNQDSWLVWKQGDSHVHGAMLQCGLSWIEGVCGLQSTSSFCYLFGSWRYLSLYSPLIQSFCKPILWFFCFSFFCKWGHVGMCLCSRSLLVPRWGKNRGSTNSQLRWDAEL